MVDSLIPLFSCEVHLILDELLSLVGLRLSWSQWCGACLSSQSLPNGVSGISGCSASPPTPWSAAHSIVPFACKFSGGHPGLSEEVLKLKNREVRLLPHI